MNNVLQKTESTTLETQQRNVTITPHATDRGNCSPLEQFSIEVF
jgi:hypothetical protein